MTTFLAWPEIEGFHNIRKFIRVDPNEWFRAKEQLSGTSTVAYKAKVKLHGTNAAVQVHPDGTIVCQSRTNIITPENDNAGFARWVNDSGIRGWDPARGHILYGEWIGPGIQKGVAVAEIPEKVFAIFAARPLDGSDTLIIEPYDLDGLVSCFPSGITGVYVLPWYDQSIDINWRQTDEELTKSTARINEWVATVEANDPWVEDTFGVKGTGEGLVWYPTSTPHLGWENFQNLVFKAKGEKHKNIKTAAPAQVSASAAADINSFVELVLTEARLEQGARTVALTPGSYDQKQTGKFIAWVVADVSKETTDEMEASGLTWKQVEKPISTKAREWYLAKARL
jgi:RNA ligase-like protein